MCPLPGAGRGIPRSSSSSCPPPTRCPFCSSGPGPSVCQALSRDLMETALTEKGQWLWVTLGSGSPRGFWKQAARACVSIEWDKPGEATGVLTPSCTPALGPSQAPGPPPFAGASVGKGLPASRPGAACQGHSLPRPQCFPLEITGLLCQAPAPASRTSWACPLPPAWTIDHPSEEGCSPASHAQPGLGHLGSQLTPALAIKAGGSSFPVLATWVQGQAPC